MLLALHPGGDLTDFVAGTSEMPGRQRWPAGCLRSLLATSVAGIVVLYLLLRLQGHLPF